MPALIARLLAFISTHPQAAKWGPQIVNGMRTVGPQLLASATMATVLEASFGDDEQAKSEILVAGGFDPQETVSAGGEVNRGFLDTVDSTLFGALPDFVANWWYGSDREELQAQADAASQVNPLQQLLQTQREVRGRLTVAAAALGKTPSQIATFIVAIQGLEELDPELIRSSI